MTKEEFLRTLKAELEKQSISNIESMIEYYDEMICDRMEDGMSEEAAVESMDSIPEIVHEAVLDKSVPALVKERVKKSRENAEKSGWGWLWITLAIIGFPIWLPLVLTAVILAFTFFIVFWVLVATLFIILLAFGISGIACLIAIVPALIYSGIPTAIASVGAGLVLIGLTVLIWKPCVAFVKSAGGLFGDIITSIKRRIFG